MKTSENPPAEAKKDDSGLDFIRKIVVEDIRTNKNEGRVHTRFPPEPNGWMHIGHAMAIYLSYSIAQEYNGLFNLRFDDTDPSKESMDYVEAIKEDIQWLGADWEDRLYFASDYFEELYDLAMALINAGKAYVCDLSVDEIREQRGSLTEPGVNSPYRDRIIKENLDLFKRMRNGEFEDGSKVLRAKIDMASPNLLMRDPIMYRIKRVSHYRTGTEWIIYPSYDFTHGESDAIEGITHSLCSLEFETHRPLYDWFVDELLAVGALKHKPRQIEFSRLNITYTITSKRKLLELVNGNYVSGWDDPRMPTIAGMRNRGFPASAMRTFLSRVGVTKREKNIDYGLLESCVREELDKDANRVMAVLNPLKIVLENYPDDQVEHLEIPNHPKDISKGTRKVPFTRELYIEQEDFMEDPPKKFYRLTVGREVRLRNAYFITCTNVVKDDSGKIIELKCTYDPNTKGGSSPDGRKVKATIHWLSKPQALKAEFRLYDRLFKREDPSGLPDYNPDSLTITKGYVEPSLGNAKPASHYQFERLGYFFTDPKEFSPDNLLFNRTSTLRDTWAKIKKSLPQSKKKRQKKK
ncbi:MAG: glutamine--tRNA ligase/YqeY domain fusion protein [Candidatus Hodarchaeales archaeon]